MWLPRAPDAPPLRPSGIVLSEPPQRAPFAAPSSGRNSVLLCSVTNPQLGAELMVGEREVGPADHAVSPE